MYKIPTTTIECNRILGEVLAQISGFDASAAHVMVADADGNLLYDAFLDLEPLDPAEDDA
ncbi:MAG: hypothetical protein M0Z66_16005 [Thermaerobacter sp.]|nr:hypothetical protein [Thermaerobacter sp.]